MSGTVDPAQKAAFRLLARFKSAAMAALTMLATLLDALAALLGRGTR